MFSAHLHAYTYVHVHTYKERERERESENGSIVLCVFMCIIYSVFSEKQLNDLESEFFRCIHFLSSFLSNCIKRGSFPHCKLLLCVRACMSVCVCVCVHTLYGAWTQNI